MTESCLHARVNQRSSTARPSLACSRPWREQKKKKEKHVPASSTSSQRHSSFLHRGSRKKRGKSKQQPLGRPLLSRVQPPIAASLHSFTSPPPLSFHQSQALVHFNGGSRSTIETSHLPVVLGHHRRYKKPRAHLVHSVPPPHLHAQAPAKGPENFVAGVRGRLHAIFVSGRCTSPTSRRR